MSQAWSPAMKIVIPVPDLRAVVRDPITWVEAVTPAGDCWATNYNMPRLWFNIDTEEYPTVPSYIEEVRKAGVIELELTQENIDYLMEYEDGSIMLVHELAFPWFSYRLSKEHIITPIEGLPWNEGKKEDQEKYRGGCNHDREHDNTPDWPEFPCAWTLWDLDALIDVPGHRVRRDGPFADIWTRDMTYRVAYPEYVDEEGTAWGPGTFMDIPLASIEKALP